MDRGEVDDRDDDRREKKVEKPKMIDRMIMRFLLAESSPLGLVSDPPLDRYKMVRVQRAYETERRKEEAKGKKAH